MISMSPIAKPSRKHRSRKWMFRCHSTTSSTRSTSASSIHPIIRPWAHPIRRVRRLRCMQRFRFHFKFERKEENEILPVDVVRDALVDGHLCTGICRGSGGNPNQKQPLPGPAAGTRHGGRRE
ncbi:hypothetical protein DESC_480006 [Desulfosarcina cetonica]|nr:hypothetical protein DESC_480006 [Desulfosarcina cetonica]